MFVEHELLTFCMQMRTYNRGQRKGEDYLEWGSVVAELTVAGKLSGSGCNASFFFRVKMPSLAFSSSLFFLFFSLGFLLYIPVLLLSSLSIPLFFFLFFFFLFQFCSSFGLPDLPYSSLVVSLSVCFFFVFFFPFCTLSFFWSSPSLVFIGKNRGRRRGWGGHCVVALNRPRGTSPPFFHHVASKWVVSIFLRESWRWNRGKNLVLPPLLRTSRGRRRRGCRSKWHRFKFFFYEQCMKWCCLSRNTSFHLNGFWRQNASYSKSVLQLSPWLAINFNIYAIKLLIWPRTLIWPQNFNFFQLKPKLTPKINFSCNQLSINSIKPSIKFNWVHKHLIFDFSSSNWIFFVNRALINQ